VRLKGTIAAAGRVYLVDVTAAARRARLQGTTAAAAWRARLLHTTDAARRVRMAGTTAAAPAAAWPVRLLDTAAAARRVRLQGTTAAAARPVHLLDTAAATGQVRVAGKAAVATSEVSSNKMFVQLALAGRGGNMIGSRSVTLTEDSTSLNRLSKQRLQVAESKQRCLLTCSSTVGLPAWHWPKISCCKNVT